MIMNNFIVHIYFNRTWRRSWDTVLHDLSAGSLRTIVTNAAWASNLCADQRATAMLVDRYALAIEISVVKSIILVSNGAKYVLL